MVQISRRTRAGIRVRATILAFFAGKASRRYALHREMAGDQLARAALAHNRVNRPFNCGLVSSSFCDAIAGVMVLYAHKRDELAKAGAVFRRRPQGKGGKPFVVELGLPEGNEVETVYLHFDQKRLTIPIVPIGGVDQLFAVFEFFGNAAAEIIRASGPPLEPFWPT